METKKLQELHILSAQGQKLTIEERKMLNDWYQKLDQEESLINRNYKPIKLSELNKKSDEREKQINILSKNIGSIIKQNEKIRQENHKLRREIEKRLMRQAA